MMLEANIFESPKLIKNMKRYTKNNVPKSANVNKIIIEEFNINHANKTIIHLEKL